MILNGAAEGSCGAEGCFLRKKMKKRLDKRKKAVYIKWTSGASVAQLVEHHVANVIVAGSIPVTRSKFVAG